MRGDQLADEASRWAMKGSMSSRKVSCHRILFCTRVAQIPVRLPTQQPYNPVMGSSQPSSTVGMHLTNIISYTPRPSLTFEKVLTNLFSPFFSKNGPPQSQMAFLLSRERASCLATQISEHSYASDEEAQPCSCIGYMEQCLPFQSTSSDPSFMPIPI